MDEFASRLRTAVQRLSLSDAEVARRLEISQQRFSHYIGGKRRPDFSMLAKICQVLATSPDYLMGFIDSAPDESEAGILRSRISAAAMAISDEATLKRAATIMDALAAEMKPD
jgi:transcriptional regulator with XRE-family HTH domain